MLFSKFSGRAQDYKHSEGRRFVKDLVYELDARYKTLTNKAYMKRSIRWKTISAVLEDCDIWERGLILDAGILASISLVGFVDDLFKVQVKMTYKEDIPCVKRLVKEKNYDFDSLWIETDFLEHERVF